MPTHRARARRWPRLRTAAIALTVGTAAVAVPILPASADDPVATSSATGANDDAVEPTARASAEVETTSEEDEPTADGADRSESESPEDDAEESDDAPSASRTAASSDDSEDEADEDDSSDEGESADDDGERSADDDTAADDTAAAEVAEAPAGTDPAELGTTDGAERVEGGDRVETSVAVAQDRFPDGYPAAVLASAEDFADALAGSALADHVDGPLLLTDQPELDERVATELTDRLAPEGTVWLLGGPDALSDDVEAAVADLGFATQRLEGPDRYGTAAAIVGEVLGDAAGCELVVATGTDFADGASASGFASATRPLLFTRGSVVPAPTAEALAACAEGEEPVAVTAVGGSAAKALTKDGAEVPEGLEVTEVVGADRYETSAELLTLVRGSGAELAQAPDAGGPVTLTSGLDYPDALIGGTYGHPVVLTEPEGLSDAVVGALEGAQDTVDGVLVIGGTESVPDDVAADALSLAADGTSAAGPAAGETVDEEQAEEPAAEGERADGEPAEDDAAPAPTKVPTATSSPTSAPRPSGTPTPTGAGSTPSKSSTGTTAPSTGPTATGPVAPPAGAGSRSWEQAWAQKEISVMRAWFEANVPGPRVPIRGTAGGGKIGSQGDADRLVGKTVTGNLSVDCSCTLHDFVLEGSTMTINSGKVVVEDVLVDGKDNTKHSGLVRVRGSAKVDIRRVQIKGHQDGIQTYTTGYTHGEYIYIHSHAKNNPEKHHQDGIQTIGGASAFSRSFVDMTGAMVSATLIKPDAMPTPYAKVNSSVMLGGGYTFHIHDGPKGTPKNVDLSGNLVGPGYKKGLMSTWELSNPSAVHAPAFVSGSGRTVTLKDAAKL